MNGDGRAESVANTPALVTKFAILKGGYLA
jgi:hypothetical protein